MGNLDRFWDHQSEHLFKGGPTEPSEGIVPFPSTAPSVVPRASEAALDLVHQAVEVIKGIENHANEAQIRARSIAERAIQKLRLTEERVEQLETELQAAQACINDALAKVRDSDETLKVERMRLEAAEKKLCQIEMRARTAETQAKENASAVFRIEEAIRNQILTKRLPLSRPPSAA
jgi:DNA repair ATPase RecN